MLRRLLTPTPLVVLALGACALAPAPAGAQTRVVGGTAAGDGEWPWQVALVQRSNGHEFCGGSLISTTKVLTAAHCVDGESTSSFDVVVGRNVLSNTSDGQRIQVSSFSEHPNAFVPPDGSPLKPRRDLALVTLSSPATDPQAKPVTIVDPGSDDARWAPGVLATVTGFGSTRENGPTSDELMRADVHMVSDSDCSAAYGSSFSSSDMVCAGEPEGGKDTCQGDSGGPLVVPNGSGGWLLAGTTSWGTGCAEAGFPGVYGRVGAPAMNSYVASSNPPIAPYVIGSPALTGAAIEGATLHCSQGNWGGDTATLTYTWARDAGAGYAVVPGATSPDLTLAVGNAGSVFKCAVKAENSTGSLVAESSAVGPVAPAPPAPRAIVDSFVPRAIVTKRRCTRTRCVITLRVDDGTDTTGIKRIAAVVTSKTRRRCGPGKRKLCTRTRRRTLRATTSDGVVWKLTLRGLKPGRLALRIRALDRAEKEQSPPTRYTFRLKRRR